MAESFVPDLARTATGNVKPWVFEWRTGESASTEPSVRIATSPIGSKFDTSAGQPLPLSLFRSDRSLAPATGASHVGTTSLLPSDAQHHAYFMRRREEIQTSDRSAIIEAGALDSLGSFVLMKIAEGVGRVPVETLEENLDGARGWLALARLISAGLLAENGRSVYVTQRGESVVGRLLQDLQTA